MQRNSTDERQGVLSMDVLGLLSGLLAHSQPLHWQHGQLRIEERNVRAIAWLSTTPRDRLLSVPDAFLRLYRTACHWWIL